MKTQCHFCSKKVSKPSNCYRHMRDVHGVDYGRKRQLYMTDGDYKCAMHHQSIRFLTRASLEQHLYYAHRGDDESLLKRCKFNMKEINQRCWGVKRNLIKYRKAKAHMQALYDKNGCPWAEIMSMDTLNHEFEILERERQIKINYKEIQSYR